MKLKGIRYSSSLEKYVYLEVNLKNSDIEAIKGVVRDFNINKGFVTMGKAILSVIKYDGSIITPSNEHIGVCDVLGDEPFGCYSLIGTVGSYLSAGDYTHFVNVSSYTLEELVDIAEKNNISEGIILYNGEVHSIIEDDCLIESKLISSLT